MKVSFFCKVDRKALDVVGFYKQDIEILQGLGYELNIATSYKEIDWSSDVIFVWWWTYAFYPVFRAKLLKKKVIITGTFNFRAPQAPSDFFRRPFWQRFLIKYSIKNATKNILVSKTEYAVISREWKLKNIYYSPHVIDTDKYKSVDTNTDSKFIFSIIWTGKANLEGKCLPEIIEAAALFKNYFPEYKFLIAGRKGDGFAYAKELISKSGLQDYVFLLGEISEKEKIEYLQTCAVYLQPSRYEGFGVAIAEAMSCGALVLTNKAGEVGNVVGDAGIVIDTIDPLKIQEELKRVVSDKKLQSRLRSKARLRIQQYFDKKVRLNDFKRLIENKE